jgi:integrase
MIAPTFKVHNKSSGRCRTVLKTGIVKYGRRSTYVARKIDDWMDGVIKDPNLAPNHSFRHYLKSVLLDRDVPERISDAITGHKTPGIGRKYEHVEMAKKFEAISKLSVIALG